MPSFNPEEYEHLRSYISGRRDRLRELDELFKADTFDEDAEDRWMEICKKATENLERDAALAIKAIVLINRSDAPTPLDAAKAALFEGQGQTWINQQKQAWQILSTRGAEFARTFLAVQALNASIELSQKTYTEKMRAFHENAVDLADDLTEFINLLEAAAGGDIGGYLYTKFFPQEDKWNGIRDSLLLIVHDRRSAKLLARLSEQIHQACSTYYETTSRSGTIYLNGLEKLRDVPRELAELPPFKDHWKLWREESQGTHEKFKRLIGAYNELTEDTRKENFFEESRLKVLRLFGKGPNMAQNFERTQRNIEKWLKDQPPR